MKHIFELMPQDVREGKGSLSISTREIGKSLGIPQKTVLFQINKCIEHGYLKNVEMIPKRAMKLKLGADFDLGKIQPDEILPPVELLRKVVS